MATINMSKKQKISMTKEDGSAVKNFFIGVNWEQIDTPEKPILILTSMECLLMEIGR